MTEMPAPPPGRDPNAEPEPIAPTAPPRNLGIVTVAILAVIGAFLAGFYLSPGITETRREQFVPAMAQQAVDIAPCIHQAFFLTSTDHEIPPVDLEPAVSAARQAGLTHVTVAQKQGADGTYYIAIYGIRCPQGVTPPPQ